MTSAIPFPLAEILREAVALNQALVDRDLIEAQHRTRLIVTLAEIYGLQEALHAANVLLSQLGSSPTGLRPPTVDAVNALSLALDRAFE